MRRVTLDNLCDGSLNSAFVRELGKLTSELTVDSKPGCITIKIKIDKDMTPNGEIILRVDAAIATKYPSVSISDDNTKSITDEGLVVERIPTSLFDNEMTQDNDAGTAEQ